MVIATKFPPGWLSTAEAFPGALDQSLVRLRRNTIGLYQHHFPSRRIPIPSLMELMADAVAAGKVRAVGVSNYSARQLRIAQTALAERGIPLASNQVEYSLLDRAPEVNGVLDACRELGITLIAYQPLAQGVLTGKYRPGDRPEEIRRFGRYFRGDGLKKAQPVMALLREIGERYSKTPAQVALRWLMEREGVLPIPGAKNGRQAARNAEALSFSLAGAEIEALDRATTPWRRWTLQSFVRPAGGRAARLRLARLRVDRRSWWPTHSEPQEGPMADEPAAPIPLDALDLESLSDEELQRLTQLLMSERERRMGLEPGPEDPL